MHPLHTLRVASAPLLAAVRRIRLHPRAALGSLRDAAGRNREDIIRVSGYSALGVVVFLFSSYLLFPANELKGRVEDALERQTGLAVEINTMEQTFFPGVLFKGVSLARKAGEDPLVVVPRAKIRMSIIPLLWKSHRLSVQAGLFNGTIRGSIKERKKSFSLSMDLERLSLGDIAYVGKAWGITLKGTMKGSAQLSGMAGVPAQYKGKIQFVVDKGGVVESSLLGMVKIPSMDFDDMRGRVIVSAGRGVLDDVIIKGKDLELTLGGDIIFQENVSQSQVNIRGRFKPSEKLSAGLSTVLPYINLQKDAQGYYLFSITGSLGAPWIKN